MSESTLTLRHMSNAVRSVPIDDDVALVWRQKRYYDVVATIQIKNVSEAAHAVLRQRAATAGQSLQEYMLAWIERAASRPTVDEVLDRVSHRSGGRLSATDVVRQLREERDRR
jgi:antitoxin FitA